jgi:hypothetical protein
MPETGELVWHERRADRLVDGLIALHLRVANTILLPAGHLFASLFMLAVIGPSPRSIGVDPAVLLHHVSGDASVRRCSAFFSGPGRMLRVNGPAFVAEVAGATGRFASVLAAVGANVPPKDLSPGSLHCRIVWLRPGYPDLSEPARGHGDARRPAPAAWGDPPAASFVRITELSRDRRRIVIILGES